MLETIAWAVTFMGLGATVVILVGIAILMISSED
jgi:hypothetical protein